MSETKKKNEIISLSNINDLNYFDLDISQEKMESFIREKLFIDSVAKINLLKNLLDSYESIIKLNEKNRNVFMNDKNLNNLKDEIIRQSGLWETF